MTVAVPVRNRGRTPQRRGGVVGKPAACARRREGMMSTRPIASLAVEEQAVAARHLTDAPQVNIIDRDHGGGEDRKHEGNQSLLTGMTTSQHNHGFSCMHDTGCSHLGGFGQSRHQSSQWSDPACAIRARVSAGSSFLCGDNTVVHPVHTPIEHKRGSA